MEAGAKFCEGQQQVSCLPFLFLTFPPDWPLEDEASQFLLERRVMKNLQGAMFLVGAYVCMCGCVWVNVKDWGIKDKDKRSNER